MKNLPLLALVLAALFLLAAPVSALTYAVSVQTDSQSYAGNSTIHISGQVSPAPGPGTGVSIRIFNPNEVLVTADTVNVNGTTGFYTDAIVTGGSSAWISGNYVVNATWGAFGPAVFGIAAFSWSQSASTTTTSTSTTSTMSSSSTSTSTSSSTSSTTSSTTTSTQSTTSTTSSTTGTSTPTPSTSTSSGGGGIPEFPYQFLTVGLFTALVVISYLTLGRGRGRSRPR